MAQDDSIGFIDPIDPRSSKNSRDWRDRISRECIECKLCQKECAFLRKYGKPKALAEAYDPSDKAQQSMAFECNLCGLCKAVCPVDIDPGGMFLEMRREAVRRGEGSYRKHSTILGYERRGTSRLYTYYALPHSCETVLFPGCALSGSRPDKVIKLHEHLKKSIPALGIVLDCCLVPSHDLGRDEYFRAMFGEMKEFLLENGVRNILVACGSCHKIFKKYGGDLSVRTVYEVLAENGLPETARSSAIVTLHDPCAVRFEHSVHEAVRDLARRKGLDIEEMPHHKKKSLCCGEGGSAGFISPALTEKWREKRRQEVQNRRILTYCAGCAGFLSRTMPTSHLLDFLFEPEAALAGKVKVSRAPLTYWNRIRLKRHFKKTLKAEITRERTFSADRKAGKSGAMTRVLVLALIVAALLAVLAATSL